MAGESPSCFRTDVILSLLSSRDRGGRSLGGMLQRWSSSFHQTVVVLLLLLLLLLRSLSLGSLRTSRAASCMTSCPTLFRLILFTFPLPCRRSAWMTAFLHRVYSCVSCGVSLPSVGCIPLFGPPQNHAPLYKFQALYKRLVE